MFRIKARLEGKTVYIVQIFFDGMQPVCAYIEENGKEIKICRFNNFEICDPVFVNAQTAYQRRAEETGYTSKTVDLSKIKKGDW